jgi:SAM domain (Sterile alpha motif)
MPAAATLFASGIEGPVDVRAWLEGHGLGRYAEVFASNDIDAEVLRTLTADDLKELGIASLGHRKKLLAAIARLQGSSPKLEPALSAAPPKAYTPRYFPDFERELPRYLSRT